MWTNSLLDYWSTRLRCSDFQIDELVMETNLCYITIGISDFLKNMIELSDPPLLPLVKLLDT